MDPSLPTARALAIAGDRIVGGVGVHETALASPERVDLGGRCVLPGSPTPTSTSRRGRWPSGRCGSRARSRSTRRSRACAPRAASGRPAAGSSASAGGAATGRADEPRSARLSTPSRADVPTALWRRTTTRYGSTRPASRAPTATSPCAAGSSSSTRPASRPGPARGGGVASSATGTSRSRNEEYVEAVRAAIRLAHARGVTAVHDKDGWLGALRIWQRLQTEGTLGLRVWQSLPCEKLPELEELGLARASATAFCASATSRRSWTGRSARGRRGCSTAQAS